MLRLSLLLCAAVLAAFVGCNKVSTVAGGMRVTGSVTLDGKAVEDAAVMFLPVATGGKGAIGRTDKTGRFHMTTGNEDGAQLGEYVVTVTKNERAQAAGPEKKKTMDEERAEALARGDLPGNEGRPDAKKVKEEYKGLVPEKYTKKETTDLKVSVAKGMGDVKLDLKTP
jgi:hypothetical protein